MKYAGQDGRPTIWPQAIRDQLKLEEVPAYSSSVLLIQFSEKICELNSVIIEAS
jgi:hypothetical protein